MIGCIKSERIVLRDRLYDGYVYFSDGKILAVTSSPILDGDFLDVGDNFVSPGFIDIHTHGGGGYDFAKSTQDVIDGCNFHLRHGTTSVCPTVSAAPFDVMAKAAEYIAAAKRDPRTKANIIGAHMEGPYLSKNQCGAQCPDFISPPVPQDYLPFIENMKDDVARWSYAPENDKDGSFCRALSKHGIVASAGHTDATYDGMQKAIKNGCKLVTHLYSCTSTVTRNSGFRSAGVIETALLCDGLYAEIIADGKHLPPELIRLVLKAKGSDRVALVTDSLYLAGTDVKHGKMMNTDLIIEDGVCKLSDRSAFAGSIATADRLIRTMTHEVGVPVYEAVKMMSAVPAEIMGLNKGELIPAMDADIVVFDDNIEISHVFVMGERII